MSAFVWTDERVELLRKLMTDGRTASQIAAEMGHGLTRNAVLGKAHRLKFQRDVVVTAAKAEAKARQRTKPATPPRSGTAAPAAAIAPKVRPRPSEVAVPPPGLFEHTPAALAVHGLVAGRCRWPIGEVRDPGFRFCCDPVEVDGKPYCAAHREQSRTAPRGVLVPSSRHGALHGRAA